MNKELIDFIFKMSISIHEDTWFRSGDKTRGREVVQEWVAEQLALGFETYTTPVGSSWGTKVTKEEFEKYWKEHGKLSENQNEL